MASCSSSLLLFLLLTSFSCIYWTNCEAATRDTLKPGDILDSSSSLISATGKFNLSFYINEYIPKPNSSYLAIMWKGSKNHAWIGNPYTPILYPTGVLTLDKNNTLKITHRGGDPIQLYPPPHGHQTSSNVVATLLDSGNFVVREVSSVDGSTKRVVWQSFDYPMDTLLPGMKLGVNKRSNGRNWSITSWSSGHRPEPGDCSLEWDPKGRELKIRRLGVVHWSSGPFRDGRFEFLSPDDAFGVRMYNFSVVSNENEDYFTYSPVNQSLKSQWVLNVFGRLFEYELQYDIARADHCYGYNTYDGCQLVTNSSSPPPSISDTINADTIKNADTTKKRIWIGTSIPATLLALVLCIVCYLLHRRRIRKFLLSASGENMTAIESDFRDVMESDRSTDHVTGLQNEGRMLNDLRVFSYASVMAATANFTKENKLGEGGFGPVYKGKLTSFEREIAVKRLSRYSGQGTLEFKNELILISELQHTNLVQLLGFCIHGEERMLIYEYMPNKSLDFFIFDSTRGMLLDWKKRFNIIEGVAQGLLYLHKYSRLRVIHRDLKASNILLDEYMNPKISDFGMARIFTHNVLEANTNRVVGTYGYMSPEYAMEGIFSIKSDVYSFGVLMLEIISGRRNNSFDHDDRVLNIVGYAWELWKEGAGLALMDPTLGDSCIMDQVLRCIHVGLLCVEEHAANRPTMSDVISMLTNESMSLTFPTKPAFFFREKMVESGQITSVNGLSTTNIIDGR